MIPASRAPRIFSNLPSIVIDAPYSCSEEPVRRRIGRAGNRTVEGIRTMKKGTGPEGILIIGVGNIYRSDDGIGIEIARSIAVRKPAEVRVIEQTGEGAALMDSWKGAAAVILIDATSSGSPPGTVHRFDVHSAPIPSKYFHYSTHAFSVAEAIELARTLKLLPPVMIVYGIEGRNFNAGTEISTPVRRSAGRVETDILADIDTVLNQ